jgi:hypothetical protein
LQKPTPEDKRKISEFLKSNELEILPKILCSFRGQHKHERRYTNASGKSQQTKAKAEQTDSAIDILTKRPAFTDDEEMFFNKENVYRDHLVLERYGFKNGQTPNNEWMAFYKLWMEVTPVIIFFISHSTVTSPYCMKEIKWFKEMYKKNPETAPIAILVALHKNGSSAENCTRERLMYNKLVREGINAGFREACGISDDHFFEMHFDNKTNFGIRIDLKKLLLKLHKEGKMEPKMTQQEYTKRVRSIFLDQDKYGSLYDTDISGGSKEESKEESNEESNEESKEGGGVEENNENRSEEQENEQKSNEQNSSEIGSP